MTSRNDADHDAVCAATDAHLVVIAPPGTGKTFLSARLAAQLAASLAPHERVLLVTFSNQARAQLEAAIRGQKVPPEVRPRIEVTNYHSFFYHAVWANRRALGLPLETQLKGQRSREQAIERICPDFAMRIKKLGGRIASLAELELSRFRSGAVPEDIELALCCLKDEHAAGRLIFDDLGALFWKLLEKYPTISSAYARRYPIVLADEHQDASELQDAVVRRLGKRKLVIFADPMQLIYGFRGSKDERLNRHIQEVRAPHSLRTTHRWHGAAEIGKWLLCVRDRLSGKRCVANRPSSVAVQYIEYISQMKSTAKLAALAQKNAKRSVAILVRDNMSLADLRSYLSRNNVHVRQIGGDDFEEAQSEMEQLPLKGDWRDLATFAIDRIVALVPSVVDKATATKNRVLPDGVKIDAKCNPEVKAILSALDCLRVEGQSSYFQSVVAALENLRNLGHPLPRLEAVRMLRETAQALSTTGGNLDEALRAYAATIARQAHRDHHIRPGIYLMTAHQAKGKEFDAVILFNVAKHLYMDDEEGKRLFYVAMTRATTSWLILAPKTDASPLIRHL